MPDSCAGLAPPGWAVLPSAPHMRRSSLLGVRCADILRPTWLLLLASGAALAGCTPEIGDECTTSIDCSQQGDRLCDTTQPGGYCTIFNCEPDTCPEDESVCVAFDFELDPACHDLNATDWARFGRTFCMAVCDDDSDCRDGYICNR